MDLDDEEYKATRILNGADRNSRTRFKNEIKVSEYLLDVMKTNQEALALYKKLGFKVIKKRFNTLLLKLM